MARIKQTARVRKPNRGSPEAPTLASQTLLPEETKDPVKKEDGGNNPTLKAMSKMGTGTKLVSKVGTETVKKWPVSHFPEKAPTPHDQKIASKKRDKKIADSATLPAANKCDILLAYVLATVGLLLAAVGAWIHMANTMPNTAVHKAVAVMAIPTWLSYPTQHVSRSLSLGGFMLLGCFSILARFSRDEGIFKFKLIRFCVYPVFTFLGGLFAGSLTLNMAQKIGLCPGGGMLSDWWAKKTHWVVGTFSRHMCTEIEEFFCGSLTLCAAACACVCVARAVVPAKCSLRYVWGITGGLCICVAAAILSQRPWWSSIIFNGWFFASSLLHQCAQFGCILCFCFWISLSRTAGWDFIQRGTEFYCIGMITTFHAFLVVFAGRTIFIPLMIALLLAKYGKYEESSYDKISGLVWVWTVLFTAIILIQFVWFGDSSYIWRFKD